MGLTVPMIVKGALGRNDLLNGNNSFYRVQPPINDLAGLMNSAASRYGYGYGMNSPLSGTLYMNQSTAGGFIAGAAVGAAAVSAMQNNQQFQRTAPVSPQPQMTQTTPPPQRTQQYQQNVQPAQRTQQYQQNVQPAQSTRQSQPVQTPVQNTPPPAPVFRRNRVQPTGDILSKGQKIQVKGADGRPANNLKICLGWDVTNPQCELDASAFMLGENDKVPGEEWFIFYGQPADPYRVVQYRVYKDDRSSPDDVSIELELDKVAPFINRITLAVTIYESRARGHNFGMVKNLYARIIDMDTGREAASFKMNECNSSVTAMVLGELYRYKGEWKFNAVGSGVNKDLAEFCGMYGIELA